MNALSKALATALATLPIATFAVEACCPSDGHNVMSAMAIPSSAGLGSREPQTFDSSQNPAWKAYVFERSGVRYVQLSDVNGNQRAAIATDGQRLMILPVGSDDVRQVSTPLEGQVVYQDMFVTVKPQSSPDGTVTWLVKLLK